MGRGKSEIFSLFHNRAGAVKRKRENSEKKEPLQQRQIAGGV